MPKLIDLTGYRFGKWTVITRAGNNEFGYARWLCRCDCGTEKVVLRSTLRNGKSTNCHSGKCHPLYKHGMSPELEYSIWYSMKRRCLYPSSHAWYYYGGRGIKICDRWLKFENFLADMGRKPSPALSIDRINNDGNYEPGNCRWATRKQQAANKRKRNK